jgi:hypothetical protein
VTVRRLSSLALALWGGWLLSRPVAENDVFWQLMLGRAVLDGGSRTVVEPSAAGWVSPTLAVPEWLWDVAAYLGWRGGGGLGLSLFVAACGALSMLAIGWWVSTEVRSRSRWLLGGLAALVGAAAAVRLRERPETLALGLAAVFLVGSRRVTRAPSWLGGAGLVLLEVLWAQVHGTFVLAVPFYAAAALQVRPRHRRAVLLLGVALVLGLGASAAGLDVGRFVSNHLAGDSVRHIDEMRAPAWSDFNPATKPWGAAVLVLSLVGAVAAARGTFTRRTLALWGLGVVLGLTAERAVSLWALLVLPQAALGWRAFGAGRWRPVLVALLGVAALGAVSMRVHEGHGPMLAFRVAPEALPEEAVSALGGLPDGAVVWTDFSVGAPIGFLAAGRLRVTMDSRCPLQFGDADFALSRDCHADAACFRRAVDVLHVTAAVVDRGAACAVVASHGGFVPVAVDSRWATFARPGPGVVPLETLDVCAPMLLRSEACGPRFVADLSRLSGAGSAFTAMLEQQRAVQCGGPVDVRLLERLLAADPRWQELRVTTGEGWLRGGDPGRGAEAFATALRAGFAPAVQPLLSALPHVELEARRRLLDSVLDELQDRAPAALRVALATTAAEQNDAVTAGREAVRAAAAGERGVVPLLRALREASSVPEERARYSAWLALLTAPSP